MLVASVALEVAGTLLLRLSEGFTQPAAAAGCLSCYSVSVVIFSRILRRGMPLAVAYGTLTGSGLAAAALLAAGLFDEPLTAVQVLGLALLAVGVVALQRRPEQRA